MKKSILFIVLSVIIIIVCIVVFMTSKKSPVTVDKIVFEPDERMAGMTLPREENGLTKDYNQNELDQIANIFINEELVAVAIVGSDVLKLCMPEVMKGDNRPVVYAGYNGTCVVDGNFIGGTSHLLSQKMVIAIIEQNQGVE